MLYQLSYVRVARSCWIGRGDNDNRAGAPGQTGSRIQGENPQNVLSRAIRN